jgi:hypothetical protein
MICQIDGCQDFEHHSPVMLEKHINKCHLDLIHIPCPALGEFLSYFSIIFSLTIIYRLFSHSCCFSESTFSLFSKSSEVALC